MSPRADHRAVLPPLQPLQQGDGVAVVAASSALEDPSALQAGLDLLTRIVDRYPETRFILITAFASIEAGVRALELGAVEYMVKPIRMKSLREIGTAFGTPDVPEQRYPPEVFWEMYDAGKFD